MFDLCKSKTVFSRMIVVEILISILIAVVIYYAKIFFGYMGLLFLLVHVENKSEKGRTCSCVFMLAATESH